MQSSRPCLLWQQRSWPSVGNSLVQRVGNVPIPEQCLLPCLQRRDRVGEKPETVVGRQYGYSKHVTHCDKHEQVLHVHSQPQRVGYHSMQSHAIEESLCSLRNLALLLLSLRLFLLSHLSRVRQRTYVAKIDAYTRR